MPDQHPTSFDPIEASMPPQRFDQTPPSIRPVTPAQHELDRPLTPGEIRGNIIRVARDRRLDPEQVRREAQRVLKGRR
jgi:hypothetical protein